MATEVDVFANGKFLDSKKNQKKAYTKTAGELVDSQGSLPPGSRMVHHQGRN